MQRRNVGTSDDVAERIVRASAAGQSGRLWTSWRVVLYAGLTLKLFAPLLFEKYAFFSWATNV